MRVLSSIFSSETLRELLASRVRIEPVTLTVILVVCAGEFALRAAVQADDELARALAVVSEGYNPPPHLFDPDLGYRYQGHARSVFVRPGIENVVHTNGDGFRDTEFVEEKAAGTFRIAVLGDSYLAGNQVPIADLWPSVLEARLPAVAGRRIELLNFGIDGYQVWNQMRLLEQVLPRYHPDLVLLAGMAARPAVPQYRRPFSARTVLIADSVAGLDEAAAQAATAAAGARTMVPDVMMEAVMLSRAAVRIAGRVPLSRVPAFVKVRTRPRRDYDLSLAQALDKMRRTCQTRGVALAVSWRQDPPPDVEALIADTEMMSVRETAFLPADQRVMTWPRDAHYTPSGHQLYAERFAPYLEGFVRAAIEAR